MFMRISSEETSITNFRIFQKFAARRRRNESNLASGDEIMNAEVSTEKRVQALTELISRFR